MMLKCAHLCRIMQVNNRHVLIKVCGAKLLSFTIRASLEWYY